MNLKGFNGQAVVMVAIRCLMWYRPLTGSMRAQFHMTRRNVEDTKPLWMMPVYTLIFMAVFVYVGREDLATPGIR